MLSFECIKNEKSVYFLLTSAKIHFPIYALGIEHIQGRICPDEQLQIILFAGHQKVAPMHPTGDKKCQEFSYRNGNPGSINAKNPRKDHQ